MRSVSATLLAAQRVSPQRPRVRLLVRDKQARPDRIGTEGNDEVQSVAVSVGSGVAVLVAALTSGGAIYTRFVSDPTVLNGLTPLAGWGSYPDAYTEVVSAGNALAWPDGDVVLGVSGAQVRLFYINNDGTEVRALTSNDNGVTWGSPATAATVAGGDTGYRFHLGSATGNDVWWVIVKTGYKAVWMAEYSGGAWGAGVWVQYLTDDGDYDSNFYGLAVVWDSSLSKYAVVAAVDDQSDDAARLVTAHWDAGTTTLSDRQVIVPPGLAMAGHVPWQPALAQVASAMGSLWVITYWETFSSGSTSWELPVCIVSRDFDHWSYKIPLGFVATTDYKRISIVAKSAAVYLHNINTAYELRMWYSGKASAELTVAHAEVLRYRINEERTRGELHVEIDNRDGTYDHPGDENYSAEALKPLAQVIIDQGLNSSAGDERVESRPFYLWSHSTVRESGVNLVRLYAVDGWQLLRMWRPDCTIHWESKTLGWCIAEIAARAGNWEVDTDGDSLWDETLTYLTISASYDDWADRWYIRALGRTIAIDEPTVMFGTNMSGLTILQHLLGLVGGMAQFGHGDEREVLYCWIPPARGAATTAVHTYNDGELLGLQDVDAFAWPTRVIVTGNGLGYEEVSSTNGMAVGMDFLQMIYASQWTTEAQLAAIASGAMADADARAYSGWLRARPNVGLELNDIIAYSDSGAGGGILAHKRRVSWLVTEYEPLIHVWRQRVYVEGV